MTEQSWKSLCRTPKSTVSKVLRSAAFNDSRERAGAMLADPVALRVLSDAVVTIDQTEAPLSAVADRVAAAVRFLRAEADQLDSGASAAPALAGSAARERLIVAALHYLVTPDDLVPDFRAGGYIDDALLISWVFGAAVAELEPFLDEDGGPEVTTG